MRRLRSQRPRAQSNEPGSTWEWRANKLCRLSGALSPSYRPSVTILPVTTAPGTNLRRQDPSPWCELIGGVSPVHTYRSFIRRV